MSLYSIIILLLLFKFKSSPFFFMKDTHFFPSSSRSAPYMFILKCRILNAVCIDRPAYDGLIVVGGKATLTCVTT